MSSKQPPDPFRRVLTGTLILIASCCGNAWAITIDGELTGQNIAEEARGATFSFVTSDGEVPVEVSAVTAEYTDDGRQAISFSIPTGEAGTMKITRPDGTTTEIGINPEWGSRYVIDMDEPVRVAVPQQGFSNLWPGNTPPGFSGSIGVYGGTYDFTSVPGTSGIAPPTGTEQLLQQGPDEFTLTGLEAAFTSNPGGPFLGLPNSRNTSFNFRFFGASGDDESRASAPTGSFAGDAFFLFPSTRLPEGVTGIRFGGNGIESRISTEVEDKGFEIGTAWDQSIDGSDVVLSPGISIILQNVEQDTLRQDTLTGFPAFLSQDDLNIDEDRIIFRFSGRMTKPVSKKVGLFGEAALRVQYSDTDLTSNYTFDGRPFGVPLVTLQNRGSDSDWSLGFDVGAGAQIILNDRFAVDAMIQYRDGANAAGARYGTTGDQVLGGATPSITQESQSAVIGVLRTTFSF